MKKPSSRIRNEIAKLQQQLQLAENREADRLGRLALKAGLGDMDIQDADLQSAFEALAVDLGANRRPPFPHRDNEDASGAKADPQLRAGTAQGKDSEA